MTILAEVIAAEPERSPAVPPSPGASFTDRPAFPNAKQVIAQVSAVYLERDAMARGYWEMAAEMLEWSETASAAQAEALPEQ